MIWKIESLHLPLLVNWKISRNSHTTKENFLVSFACKGTIGQGEVAFNIRYGESKESILNEFRTFVEAFSIEFERELEKMLTDNLSPIKYVSYFEQNLKKFKLSKSLSFGINSAFVHWLAHYLKKSVHEILGLNTIKTVETSFSIPIMEIGEIENFVNSNNLQRFSALKLKVDQDNATDLLNEVSKHFRGKIRIDGNECWKSVKQYKKFEESIIELNKIEFIEQPFSSEDLSLYQETYKFTRLMVMADESITDNNISKELVNKFHAVNIKLMKSGGYLNAIKQLEQARELGLSTMIGCMIETGLGISSALNIADKAAMFDLDGFLLIKDDPFNAVFEDQGHLYYRMMH